MSTTLDGFNADQHKPMEDFDAIPAGEYHAIATESEMKPTKSGDGQYLQITWEIIDGDYKGRRLWSRLNLENKNATAVDLAQRELSSICRAVGVLRPRDSAEFHGKPVSLKVGVEVRKDTGDNSNRIKGYAPVGTAPSTAPAASAGPRPAPAPSTTPATGGKPPWRS